MGFSVRRSAARCEVRAVPIAWGENLRSSGGKIGFLCGKAGPSAPLPSGRDDKVMGGDGTVAAAVIRGGGEVHHPG